MGTFDSDKYPLQKETDKILKMAVEVHKHLGGGFLEIVYKDALEHEFLENEYIFNRGQEFAITYKGTVLKHKFIQILLHLTKSLLK